MAKRISHVRFTPTLVTFFIIILLVIVVLFVYKQWSKGPIEGMEKPNLCKKSVFTTQSDQVLNLDVSNNFTSCIFNPYTITKSTATHPLPLYDNSGAQYTRLLIYPPTPSTNMPNCNFYITGKFILEQDHSCNKQKSYYAKTGNSVVSCTSSVIKEYLGTGDVAGAVDSSNTLHQYYYNIYGIDGEITHADSSNNNSVTITKRAVDSSTNSFVINFQAKDSSNNCAGIALYGYSTLSKPILKVEST